jgi:hypothetical protein
LPGKGGIRRWWPGAARGSGRRTGRWVRRGVAGDTGPDRAREGEMLPTRRRASAGRGIGPPCRAPCASRLALQAGKDKQRPRCPGAMSATGRMRGPAPPASDAPAQDKRLRPRIGRAAGPRPCARQDGLTGWPAHSRLGPCPGPTACST